MAKINDWTLKNKKWYQGGNYHYKDSDIEILRQKLIDDMHNLIQKEKKFDVNDKYSLYGNIRMIINKRFGVD